ncbi:putative quinol monooxygenase [Blastococcus sp. BMG 814]|uniref:Quinol monooxygenase n=1 Tax=Blastococcus carthaginiensis TaxID=3050034 RepID=A0ABT9I7X4_9ACTN|nr:putative quinol monooxygenase [Blastococcus carthaginiensis]MDP5181664.1 putative quinol monooxygenase [Blastococcus carthaginiensis]
MIGSATAAPGRRAELLDAARTMAAATRTDGGCLAYSFAADLEDDDRILSIEVWADRAALDEHMTHDHTREFLRVAPGLVTGEPVMSFHDVAEAGPSVGLARANGSRGRPAEPAGR